MHNAQLARQWLIKGGITDTQELTNHFIAVTSNISLAEKFGISPTNCLQMWDWVGGRFSVWSAVGFSLCVGIGFTAFRQFLQGAHWMDLHFSKAPLSQNIPVIMGLLGVLYNDYHGAQTHAVIPYEQALERFPAHLQQLDMESNGKRISRDGSVIEHSGPVVWGEPGTNGQHAFFQLLHQGTKLIPVDLLVGIQGQMKIRSGENEEFPITEAHRILVANCIAQGEALLRGKSLEEVKSELGTDANSDPSRQESLLLHRSFPGNRPSNTFVYQRLDATTMGMILAAYEHKVYVQGIMWNINSFDQWGVELGKQLTKDILNELTGMKNCTVHHHDSSTAALIDLFIDKQSSSKAS